MSPDNTKDLEAVAKAFSSLQHFANTKPGENENPGKFHNALTDSIRAGLFTNDDLEGFGVTPEVLSKAFDGASTGIKAETRSKIVAIASIRAARALGIPTRKAG